MVAVGTLTILIVVGFGFIDTGQCEQQKKKRELFCHLSKVLLDISFLLDYDVVHVTPAIDVVVAADGVGEGEHKFRVVVPVELLAD